MCEVRGAAQYDKVPFGVHGEGGAAEFGDANGCLNLVTVTRVTANIAGGARVAGTIAKDCPALEVEVDVALAVGVGKFFDADGGVLGEPNDGGLFSKLKIDGGAGVGPNGGGRGQDGAGANWGVSRP